MPRRGLHEEGNAGDIYLFKKTPLGWELLTAAKRNYLVGRHGELSRLETS